MSELIVNPEIPYIGEVPGKLEPGKMCRIQGVTLPQIDRFTVNLQTGPTPKPRDDTALHISVRIKQGYIARNSYISGEWGDEDGTGRLPIGPAQSFEILILIDARSYKVAINGEHFCEFPHRIPFENVTHLLIEGDVNITLISWELSVPVIQNQQSQSAVSTNASQQQNLPPNTQPQGPYGGPPQYGPPPQFGPPQYGPPGPQQEQSGFGGFLEQAQEALVGAIKSGAAEKLLSGLLSTGDKQGGQQGYAPQNAQYGLYPQLPRDDLTKPDSQNSHNPGPLESLLSGLLSNNSSNQQQIQANHPPPQVRPEPDNYQVSNQNHGNVGWQNSPQKNDGDNSNANILSGLLVNLLSTNHNNSPQNFPPQQQQQQQGDPAINYGQYPGPPPQQQQHQSQGPLESLLSGIIPSGNTQQYQQQPSVPQVGGQGSVGGLGSMGGILSNFAGQILHPKGN